MNLHRLSVQVIYNSDIHYQFGDHFLVCLYVYKYIYIYICIIYHLKTTELSEPATCEGESMAAVANMAINGSALPTAIPEVADAAPKAGKTKTEGGFLRRKPCIFIV